MTEKYETKLKKASDKRKNKITMYKRQNSLYNLKQNNTIV